MVGFCVVLSKRGPLLEGMDIERPFLERWEGVPGSRVSTHRLPEFSVAVSDLLYGDRIAATDRYVLALAGDVYDDTPEGSGPPKAACLLDQFQARGIAGLHDLDGSFIVILYDNVSGELRVIADRVGNGRAYYWDSPDTLVVCSQYGPLTALSDFRIDLDEFGLVEFLCYGCCLEDRTMFKGVRTLESRHELVCRDGRLRVSKYWDYDLVDSEAKGTVGDYADEYYALLKGSIEQRTRAGSVLPLTAGLDSRMLACVMSMVRNPGTVSTFTLGDEGCYDVVYARKLARIFGYPYEALPIPPGYFQAYVENGVKRSDGAIIGHTCWRMAADDWLKQHRGKTMLFGYWGEFVRVYEDEPGVQDQNDLEEIYRLRKAKHHEWMQMQDSELPGLLRPDVHAQTEGFIDKTLRRLFFDAPFERPRYKLDYMSATQWWPRRFARMITDYYSDTCKIAFPFNGMKAVEFGLKLPMEIRKDGKINRSIFTRFFPEASAVPMASNAKPLAAGPLTNAYYSAVGFGRYRALPAVTFGRAGGRNRGAYVHYLKWLREHNAEYVRQVLSQREYYDDVLNPERVDAMCDEVLSGWSGDYGKIYNLVTFVLFRKMLFRAPSEQTLQG